MTYKELKSELIFDNMTKKYQKEVMDIFNYYIENSYAAYPELKLPYKFFHRFIEMTKGYPAFIVKNKKTKNVIGFCFLRAYNPFPVFKETAEITYFIGKNDVGKGIGKEMLKKLEEEAKKIGIKRFLANISSKNIQSIQFHKKNGFKKCGQFHNVGNKKGKNFDVVWMEKALN